MRVAVGSDHAGFLMKESLIALLDELGHEVLDCGTNSVERVDYPDFGAAVGRAVANGEAQCGVCVCGSGIGIAMAANKVAGVRAATVWDVTSALLARQHNDANVICLGQRLIGAEVAAAALQAWLGADFEGGRHSARVNKINVLES
ncbi:MAG: ribose 5-phosphate isomerase B [Acidimicrobiia bacterium]|nr:ribose 5-phosphate isomerase B [Acidimicrobiia bacterium]MCY4458172.1 ribose 5-phosphate isomerase B [Acidimicrobiaceae bacterium]